MRHRVIQGSQGPNGGHLGLDVVTSLILKRGPHYYRKLILDKITGSFKGRRGLMAAILD